MTTQEKLQSMLEANGMFEKDSKAVVELAKPEIQSVVPDYKITWHRPASEYPEQLFNVWFNMTKPIALKYIEQNCPKAWFKPMFQQPICPPSP